MKRRTLSLLAALLISSSLASGVWAEPRAILRGDLDEDLRERIERAIGETDDPPASRFQARRRARAAVEDAIAVLRSEGYYQPVVEDDVEGEETPLAVVRVTPGPRFVLTEPQVEWTDPAPDADSAAAAVEALELEAGDPGRAADVVGAEGRLVAALVQRGYADARAGDRRVVVDHAQTVVQPTYRIDPGGLVRLDGVELVTSGPTNPRWVAGLAPWSSGDPYDPEDVAELERRLLETGVYDSIAVALSPIEDVRPDGLRPVLVTLSDSPRRTLEAGVSYSTSEGAGVDAAWTWRNRFGRADTLRFGLRLAELDSRLDANLSLPHWRRPGRTLDVGAALIDEDTDAYDRTAASLTADLRQRIGKTSYISYGAGLDTGRYVERRFFPLTGTVGDLERNLTILTGRASAYMDRSNDPLDPTRGWRVSLSAQPTAVTGDSQVVFLRLESQGTAYLPLDDQGRTILAGRLRLGSIVGGDELSIPSDRLFYSGGGGSVRGYQYQGVGPRLDDNTPRGGLSLFETSLEVRRDIGEKWGAAAFVDGGAIGFEEIPNLSNLRWAAGVGVRYNLPFGPIRADIAVPLDPREGDPDFQIYVSIGQAF